MSTQGGSPSKHKAATLSPQGKKIARVSEGRDVGGLELFGIKKSKKESPNQKNVNRDSYIKMCLVKDGGESYAIVFRFEPKDPSNVNGSWSEKTMFECIRSGTRFVRVLNVNTNVEFWYHDNEAVRNGKGYKIRLFSIDCDGCPGEDSLHGLANRICQEVNDIPGNNTTASIEEGELMWISGDAVWSDVVGVDRSLEKLLNETGQPEDGYYENNRDLIHAYFHPESLSMDLARILRAPMEQLHPDFRPQVNNNEDEQNDQKQSEDNGSNDEDYIKIAESN